MSQVVHLFLGFFMANNGYEMPQGPTLITFSEPHAGIIR
jgi:hypothetical protein